MLLTDAPIITAVSHELRRVLQRIVLKDELFSMKLYMTTTKHNSPPFKDFKEHHVLWDELENGFCSDRSSLLLQLREFTPVGENCKVYLPDKGTRSICAAKGG